MSGKPEKIYISDMGLTMINSTEGVYIKTEPDIWMKNEYIRADLAKPSEWISVETPPVDMGEYLVIFQGRRVILEFTGERFTWGDGDYMANGHQKDITHWKPLPSPPTRETP